MAKVLIIDDDHTMGRMLTQKITRMGHEAIWSNTLQKGVETSHQYPFDVVLLDVGMPDGNGIDALPMIRRSPFSPEVVVITGLANIEDAETAIKKGAYDYIPKIDLEEGPLGKLQQTLAYHLERQTAPSPSNAVPLNLEGLIGGSEAMQRCHQLIAKAAQSDANVLISGETGTGKELFARAIHHNSYRREKSMVVVDCAALPDTLVESLLFGSVRGAFTGADRSRQGLVAQAHGGTLFLDEVGEMPLNIQKVFLRFLQERSYRPVGGADELSSDFRLIAATNRNLDEMVREGLFRKDLLYRLRTLQLSVPTLAQRREDIALLACHYVDKICMRQGIRRKTLTDDFMETLKIYDWPGNIRELINTIETAMAMSSDHQKLFARHLPEIIRLHAVRRTIPQEPQPSSPSSLCTTRHGAAPFPKITSLKEYRKKAAAEAEKAYLHHLLMQTGSDINYALHLSKLSRSRFYELLKAHDIAPIG